MPDETLPVTPPAAITSVTPADAAKPETLLNYKEVVELRKETRENAALLKQLLEKVGQPTPAAAIPTPPAPAKDTPPKGDEVTTRVQSLEGMLTTMQRDGALKDAFLEHGITDAKARELLKNATAGLAADKVAEYVASNAAFFKAASAAAPAKPATPIAPGTSDTGTAGGTARAVIPNDITAIDPEVWKTLSPEEKRKRWETERRARGGDFNPFAAARKTGK